MYASNIVSLSLYTTFVYLIKGGGLYLSISLFISSQTLCKWFHQSTNYLQWLTSVLHNGLSCLGASLLFPLRMETDSASKTLCFFKNLIWLTTCRNSVIRSVKHRHQNYFKFILIIWNDILFFYTCLIRSPISHKTEMEMYFFVLETVHGTKHWYTLEEHYANLKYANRVWCIEENDEES